MNDNTSWKEDPLSTLYHALRASRRRCVIQAVEDADEQPLSTRELARRIASQEKQVATSKATGEPYRNAYNALSQTHLPALSEANIIIYDSKRQTVSQGTSFELAALLLSTNKSMSNTIYGLQGGVEEEGNQ